MISSKKLPQRQCTGCREMKNKKEMIRVIRTPEGEILLDGTGKKNGRGAYLCREKECLAKAVRSHGLERSLKTSVPAGLYEKLMEEFDQLEKA